MRPRRAGAALEEPMKLPFVESKRPDFRRIADLLEESAAANRWANRGPLHERLRETVACHVERPPGTTFVPVANGGMALEAMARLVALEAGRRLRWVASAYSFWNLGRGYFHDVAFLDADTRGLLDLAALKALDPSGYDGIVLTNPFGLYRDLGAYAAFARQAGKALIVDNASGLCPAIADWGWQAFSLHHTKPYGVGEAGLALVPQEAADALYGLLDYCAESHGSPHWLQNGKLSDISCAFLIDRLERAGDWVPRYEAQRERAAEIARGLGFRPLATPPSGLPLTSLPLLSARDVTEEAIRAAAFMTLAKYYKPLRSFATVSDLYARLVNVPCHADVEGRTDGQIEAELRGCLGGRN